jgi:hypothetical protein
MVNYLGSCSALYIARILVNCTEEATCRYFSGNRWTVAEPLPGSPMIVFVNCKSGGGHGERFMRRFKQILNPGQVFDIANEGPTFG